MRRDPSLQLVVFDMAGTTVHDENFVFRAFSDALAAAGVTPGVDEVNRVMGYPKPEAIRQLLKAHLGTAPTDQVELLHADFLKRMNAFYKTSPEVREVDGAAVAFRSLRAQGLKIALNTGFSRTTADIIIDRMGWAKDGLLDATVTSDEVNRGRPHPDMIERAMELVGISEPSNVAKIGDTPSDLLEGTAAGCGFVIGVTAGSHTREELAPHPHTHLVHSVADVPELLVNSADA